MFGLSSGGLSVSICKQYMDWISSRIVVSAVNLPADCINLGQGYMNFAPPKWVTEAAEVALHDVAPNHYSHPRGRIRLREAIKSFYAPQFNRELDVESEILVTSGANEGLHSTKTSMRNLSN
jgi:kynurenine aminotransferase